MADDEVPTTRRTTIRPPVRAYDVVVRKVEEAAAARGDLNAPTLGAWLRSLEGARADAWRWAMDA